MSVTVGLILYETRRTQTDTRSLNGQKQIQGHKTTQRQTLRERRKSSWETQQFMASCRFTMLQCIMRWSRVPTEQATFSRESTPKINWSGRWAFFFTDRLFFYIDGGDSVILPATAYGDDCLDLKRRRKNFSAKWLQPRRQSVVRQFLKLSGVGAHH